LQIANNPALLTELAEHYTEITLAEYLIRYKEVRRADIRPLAVVNQTIYIDKSGNPFGSVYIRKGERIAQMVFNEIKQANFIPHDNPELIGHNRGGGFGSTGTK
jgi:dUTP pyrophosphatase